MTDRAPTLSELQELAIRVYGPEAELMHNGTEVWLHGAVLRVTHDNASLAMCRRALAAALKALVEK